MAEVLHSEHNDIFKNESAASIAYQSMLVHVSDRWRLENNSVRTSAEHARQRILQRLAELLPEDPPVEYKFTFRDMWSHKVFAALLRRYGLNPYR